ncbi:MAG: 16S rRNA (guanine(527)-N(7))-methyltransferase RsmG [Microcella sp.]
MKHSDVEPEPAAAAQVLGAQLETARDFAARLAEVGEELGLIGPVERTRLWSRHILNCALVAPYLRSGARVADVGSGAGLPGLVLAIARPDVELVLIEPMERRTAWLLDESRRLELGNVTVLRARAEEAIEAGPFDQVTARAVKALRQLIPMTRPLLEAGGEMLFLKGSRVEAEIEDSFKQRRAARLGEPEVLILGEGVVPEPTRLFRATVVEAS